MNCPHCHRPVNEGNSPNAEECHETQDDEGLCDAYRQIWELKQQLQKLEYLNEIEQGDTG